MYELSQPVGSDKKEYRHKIVFLGHRRQPGTWLERPCNICSITNHTTIIIGDVGNTESDTLWLSRPYAQLTHFGGSNFGVSF